MDWPSPSSLSQDGFAFNVRCKRSSACLLAANVKRKRNGTSASPGRDFPRLHEVITQDRPRQQIGTQHQGTEQDGRPHADVESLANVTSPVEAIDIGEKVEESSQNEAVYCVRTLSDIRDGRRLQRRDQALMREETYRGFKGPTARGRP